MRLRLDHNSGVTYLCYREGKYEFTSSSQFKCDLSVLQIRVNVSLRLHHNSGVTCLCYREGKYEFTSSSQFKCDLSVLQIRVNVSLRLHHHHHRDNNNR